MARFCVPLDMNKLDFRDYLFNGYGVRALAVKTYIKQRPVEVMYNYPKLKGRSVRAQWHRRRAIKFMTVEMDQPFVWPQKPTEEELNTSYVLLSYYYRFSIANRSDCRFNKKQYKASTKHQEDEEKDSNPHVPWKEGSDGMPRVKEDRKLMAQQAKDLLSGKFKWEPTWKTLGRPYER